MFLHFVSILFCLLVIIICLKFILVSFLFQDFKAHQILSEQNIFIVEQAALNVTELPAAGYKILALPMKIRNGTGAPCRLVAMP